MKMVVMTFAKFSATKINESMEYLPWFCVHCNIFKNALAGKKFFNTTCDKISISIPYLKRLPKRWKKSVTYFAIVLLKSAKVIAVINVLYQNFEWTLNTLKRNFQLYPQNNPSFILYGMLIFYGMFEVERRLTTPFKKYESKRFRDLNTATESKFP